MSSARLRKDPIKVANAEQESHLGNRAGRWKSDVMIMHVKSAVVAEKVMKDILLFWRAFVFNRRY